MVLLQIRRWQTAVWKGASGQDQRWEFPMQPWPFRNLKVLLLWRLLCITCKESWWKLAGWKGQGGQQKNHLFPEHFFFEASV